MTYEAMKELLGISELYTVTRERIEQELETVLSMVDEGQSPILITDDGKPDLLLFSWEDYKRRFSHLCSADELGRGNSIDVRLPPLVLGNKSTNLFRPG